MKLTDTHRIVLTAAANHALLPLPKSLKLTAEKSTALITQLIKAGLAEERAATPGEPVWRKDEAAGAALTVTATPTGLAAVGITPGDQQPAPTTSARKKLVKASVANSKSRADTSPAPKAPKATSKLGALTTALRNKKGATLPELMTLTGWQSHSVRGAISGALKKKLGLAIDSAMVEGRGRVYRIVE